ncbi:TerB family tellurite resistance protein [Wenyingzhuangia sp. IMCC45533]
MSILNIFLSGTQKKNRGHLANIVKIARSNGKLNRDEIKLLKKIKKDLNISDLAFRTIIRKPELYPMNPPSNYDERIERLYALANMILVDKESFDLSVKLLEKLAVGIGFPLQTHEQVVKIAVELAQKNADLEMFSQEIKRANSNAKV